MRGRWLVVFVCLGFGFHGEAAPPLMRPDLHEETAHHHEELPPEILEAGEDWMDQIRATMPPEVHLAAVNMKATYPVKGGAQFIAGLGVPRSGGRRHQGVDLGAPTGRPIIAAWEGLVLYARQNGLGGYAVKLGHMNGLSTYYAHMNRPPEVSPGQWVPAGFRLGGVGMSGNARGTVPHLHFEVRQRSAVLNPLKFISRTGEKNR